jgi:hypothetical protein
VEKKNNMAQNFRGQKLEGADFAGQDLQDADFRGASLEGANFHGARLQRAQFKGASVRGVDFTDADLTDTDLVQVREANKALWPVGFDWQAHIVPPVSTPRSEAEKMHTAYFDAEGKLKEIPVGQTRQRFVLEHLVLAFEKGVQYPEKMVNERLKAFHPDFATLRRYLIDHQLMARENNIYWRTNKDTKEAVVAS